MPLPEILDKHVKELVEEDAKFYSIKRIYNKYKELSMIQVLDTRGKIFKCLFYDDHKRLSNLSIYNTDSGKEIRNITYRSDGKTISSIREYNSVTQKLSNVTFYKEDGKSPSSTIEYDNEGKEVQFSLYCDDGEIITQCI